MRLYGHARELAGSPSVTARTKRRARAVAGSAAIVIVIAVGAVWYFAARSTPRASPPALAQRPFSATSPWNTPITGAPPLDPRSTEMVKTLTTGANQAVANIDAYGLPIYVSSPTDPTYSVRCTLPGACPFARRRVPIPSIAKPSTGTDHAMVVVDTAASRIYEFWQARTTPVTGCTGAAPTCERWDVSWGAIEALDGNGGPSVSGAPGSDGQRQLGARGSRAHP